MSWLAPRERLEVAPEHRDGGRLAHEPEGDLQEHEGEAVAEVVREVTLRNPRAPRTIPRPERAVMQERQVRQAARPPACQRGSRLLDGLPADPLLDRRHRFEAGPAIGARGAADVTARDAIGTPAAAVELVAGAAGDPKCAIDLEGGEHPLEEVGLEGDVGVELEHDVGPVPEPRESR